MPQKEEGPAVSHAGLPDPVGMSASSPSESLIPKPVDFVCEQDVRAALQTRDKIYIDAKTIVTPAAWDLGTMHEVFVRV